MDCFAALAMTMDSIRVFPKLLTAESGFCQSAGGAEHSPSGAGLPAYAIYRGCYAIFVCGVTVSPGAA
jgi:hypothetical protein